jgi:hypothetical protein
MRLSSLQQVFTLSVAQIINYAYAKGYTLTFGDAYRDPRLHGEHGEGGGYGSRNSCHKFRLAVDFNLRVNGALVYDGNHPAWKDIGDEWKRIHPKARWGGDFKSKDSNHLSFEWQGFR